MAGWSWVIRPAVPVVSPRLLPGGQRRQHRRHARCRGPSVTVRVEYNLFEFVPATLRTPTTGRYQLVGVGGQPHKVIPALDAPEYPIRFCVAAVSHGPPTPSLRECPSLVARLWWSKSPPPILGGPTRIKFWQDENEQSPRPRTQDEALPSHVGVVAYLRQNDSVALSCERVVSMQRRRQRSSHSSGRRIRLPLRHRTHARTARRRACRSGYRSAWVFLTSHKVLNARLANAGMSVRASEAWLRVRECCITD
jgi:hypothetical protein